jgi:hypothetical protein
VLAATDSVVAAIMAAMGIRGRMVLLKEKVMNL